MTATLQTAIADGKQLADWVAEQVDGIELHGGFRARLSGACFFVALDHHAALLLNAEHGLMASALALIRCEFDAYLRGCWLAFIATEKQVESFSEGVEPPKVWQIVRDLEEHPSFKSGVLKLVKDQTYPMMCDFNHTGIGQVSRNLTEEGIGRAYDDDAVVAVIHAASSWALLVLVALASLARDEGLTRRAERRALQLLT